ncbi:MAG: hypothetical protein AB7P37_03330 [Ramlibacter sp.]
MQLEIPECFDSIDDALKAAVMALGGFKKVGVRLRPDYDNSDEWLRKCLSGDRRERLTPVQVIWILREARAVGFHSAMDYVASTAGYKATPVDAQAQAQELATIIVAGVEQLNRQVALLGRLQGKAAL